MSKKPDKLSFEIIEAMNLPTLVPWRAPSVSEIDLRIKRLTVIHDMVNRLTAQLELIHVEYKQHVEHLADLGITVYYNCDEDEYMWELDDVQERSEDNDA